MINLHFGDWVKSQGTFGSVDAVITDSPYGVRNRNGEQGKRVLRSNLPFKGFIQGDDRPFDPTPFLGYPVVVLFGANNFADKLPPSRGWVVWDKKVDMDSAQQGDAELIWTNQDVPIRIFSHRWRGVIRDSQNGDKHFHPNEKPIALMEYLVSQFTKEGDTVLDPFMGSGTTGVACVRLKRNFIGCEIDPCHFEVAEKRILKATIETPLDSSIYVSTLKGRP